MGSVCTGTTRMIKPRFEDLVDHCKTTDALPKLPKSAYRLVQELDKEQPNAIEIERLIHADPTLTANIFRTACSAIYGVSPGNITTVRAALNVLGLNTLKSIAVATWVQAAFDKPDRISNFDANRFTGHGTFTGFLSKYFLSAALRCNGHKSKFSPDELFAAAVLHDLGVGVLAFVAPGLSGSLHRQAQQEGVSVADAFEAAYGEPIKILGYEAAKTWNLPNLLTEVLDPNPAEKDELANACVEYACYLADQNGFSLHGWSVERTVGQHTIDLVGFADEELPEILELITRYASDYAQLSKSA
jgi:HD-like signal output (HDOD) protein